MRSSLFFISAVWLTVGLTGCENCGPTAEPRLLLSLPDTVSVVLDTLYAINSTGPLPAQSNGNNSPFRTGGNQITLPINLNADSTQYVFKLRGRPDTVTVYYQRDFSFKNRKCGYVIELVEPKTGLNARTSRGQVLSTYYQQNRGSTIISSKSDTGISLVIRL